MAGLVGVLIGVVQLLIAMLVDLPWVIRGLIATTGIAFIGVGASLIQTEIRKDRGV